MPILAYFDQTHIGRFTDAQVDRLIELSEAGRLVAPVSPIHLVETLTYAQEPRQEVVRRLVAISGGRGLPLEAELALLEWHAHRGSGRPVRSLLQGPPTWTSFAFSAQVASVLPHLATVPDKVVDGLRSEMGAELAKAAEAHETNRRLPIEKALAWMAEGLAVTSNGAVSPTEVLSDVSGDEESVASVFRALGARRSIYRRRGVLEPNDVMDLAFVCVCLPYFDIVGVDAAMNKILRRTRRAESEPIVANVHRAKVAYRPEQLMREIETMLVQPAPPRPAN